MVYSSISSLNKTILQRVGGVTFQTNKNPEEWMPGSAPPPTAGPLTLAYAEAVADGARV